MKLSSPTSLAVSLLLASLYVVFFYYPKAAGLKGKTRDHVDVIKHRVRAVYMASFLSVLICWYLVATLDSVSRCM